MTLCNILDSSNSAFIGENLERKTKYFLTLHFVSCHEILCSFLLNVPDLFTIQPFSYCSELIQEVIEQLAFPHAENPSFTLVDLQFHNYVRMWLQLSTQWKHTQCQCSCVWVKYHDVQAKTASYGMNPIFFHHFPFFCRGLGNNMLTEIPESVFNTTTELQQL